MILETICQEHYDTPEASIAIVEQPGFIPLAQTDLDQGLNHDRLETLLAVLNTRFILRELEKLAQGNYAFAQPTKFSCPASKSTNSKITEQTDQSQTLGSDLLYRQEILE